MTAPNRRTRRRSPLHSLRGAAEAAGMAAVAGALVFACGGKLLEGTPGGPGVGGQTETVETEESTVTTDWTTDDGCCVTLETTEHSSDYSSDYSTETTDYWSTTDYSTDWETSEWSSTYYDTSTDWESSEWSSSYYGSSEWSSEDTYVSECVYFQPGPQEVACNTASDCAAVPTGELCTSTCLCGDTPVNQSGLAQYQAIVQDFPPNYCPCAIPPPLGCVNHVCTW